MDLTLVLNQTMQPLQDALGDEFKRKKKHLSTIIDVVPFESAHFLFLLPSELSKLEQHQGEIIDVVGIEAYTQKVDALLLAKDVGAWKRFARSTSPYDPRVSSIMSALVEIYWSIKEKKLNTKYVHRNYANWIQTLNHLGVWSFRYVLEDAIFEFLNPDEYELITSIVTKNYEAYREMLEGVVAVVSHNLRESNIDSYEFLFRRKNIFGIFRKMQDEEQSINHINDIFGLRLLMNTIPDCYQALDIIQSLWPEYKQDFRDYIKKPKKNQYQSLHTTVSGLGRQIVEFQIRTHEMHKNAQFGPASHADYKNNITRDYFSSLPSSYPSEEIREPLQH